MLFAYEVINHLSKLFHSFVDRLIDLSGIDKHRQTHFVLEESISHLSYPNIYSFPSKKKRIFSQL